jgi:hypothetical protein
MKIYAFVICCLLMMSNALGQSTSKWSSKHIDILESFGSDTSDIRGIQLSINEASILRMKDVYKEIFYGSSMKDFYLFELKSSEIPSAFINRPLDIYEIIDLYLMLNLK